MLRRFYVNNFKTHLKTTYEPSPVNLLLGVHDSGKTNLCQALRFLGLTTLLPVSRAASVAAKEAGSRIVVESETLSLSAPGFENSHLILDDQGRVQLLHEPRSRGTSEQHVSTTAPVAATMLSRPYDLKDNPRANLFKRHLGSWPVWIARQTGRSGSDFRAERAIGLTIVLGSTDGCLEHRRRLRG